MRTPSLFIIILVGYCQFSNAQILKITDIQPSFTHDFFVAAKLLAITKEGKQMIGLSPNDVLVMEQSIQREIISIRCPEQAMAPGISAVLTLDISGSMTIPIAADGTTRLSVAQDAATSFVTSLPDGVSEAAITSFDGLGYLNQQFTSDKIALTTAIRRLRPGGGTNYVAGLIDPSGGLTIASARATNNKRVVVFLTDGEGLEPQADTVIRRAKTAGITIHCIALALKPRSGFLQTIAANTGGLYFESVTSATALQNAYNEILRVTRAAIQPCDIVWRSACPTTATVNAELSLPQQQVKAVTSYIPIKLGFSFSQDELAFDNVQANFAFRQVVQFQNVGSLALRWATPSRLGETPFFIEAVEPNPTPAGGLSSVTIWYAGGKVDTTYTAIVTVSDPCRVNSGLRLRANTLSKAPAKLLTPSRLIFPSSLVCEPAQDLNLRLVNTGASPLTIASLSLSDTLHFQTFYKTPISIQAAADTTITLRFAPRSALSTQAILSVVWTTATDTNTTPITLLGRKDRAGFEFFPPSAVFMGIPPDSSRAQRVEFRNDGTIPFQFLSPPFTIAPRFTIEKIEPNPVPTGSSATLEIRFGGGDKGEKIDSSYTLRGACGAFATLRLSANVKETVSVPMGSLGLHTNNARYATIAPNPAQQQCAVTFSLDKQEVLFIKLVRYSGDYTKTMWSGKLGAGEHTINLSIGDQAAGMYLLVVQTLTERRSEALLITR